MEHRDIRFMIGQHLVAGFQGTRVPEELVKAVREHKIGNVILFAHNVESAGQLKQLCADIQELMLREVGVPAFITIDQEGGAVSRLPKECAVVPSAMAVASTGNTDNAYQAGLITGKELHALGVNFDLAPVFDVNSNPQNPVIGVRSYGDKPDAAAAYATAMFQGLLEGGVLCCGKHFPGHGDTAVDSHVGLPKVDKSLEELRACELKAFQAGIDAGIPGIMSTHILFPQIEKGKTPATMSRAIMTGLLRDTMGFTGLTLSDCMMMGAIADQYGTVNGMVEALKAGVDLIFASHSVDLCVQAAEKMREAVDKGDKPLSELEESLRRILSYKEKITPTLDEEFALIGSPAHRAVVDKLYEDSLTIARLPLGHIPPLGDNPLFVSCLPFVTTLASNPVMGELSFAHDMQSRFGGDAHTMPTDPSALSAAAIGAMAQGHTSVVVGTYNAHIKRGQLDVVEKLARCGVPVTVFALRNPYDLAHLPEGVTGIAAYAYNRPVLDKVAKVLSGELVPRGTMPVQL